VGFSGDCMSYDIMFGVKVAGTEDVFAKIGEPEYSSPTYNVGIMFRKCMDWDFEQGEWYNMKEVLPKIEHGLHEIRFNSGIYIQYEPENGWGNTETVLHCLQSIIDWFHYDWDEDIPLECIYMRW